MESLNQFNNNINNQNFQIQNTSNSLQQQEINDQEKVMNKIVLNQKRENFRVEIRKTKTKDLLNNLREKRLVNIQSQTRPEFVNSFKFIANCQLTNTDIEQLQIHILNLYNLLKSHINIEEQDMCFQICPKIVSCLESSLLQLQKNSLYFLINALYYFNTQQCLDVLQNQNCQILKNLYQLFSSEDIEIRDSAVWVILNIILDQDESDNNNQKIKQILKQNHILKELQDLYGTFGATENLIQNLAFFFKKYFKDNFEVENIEETLAFTDDLLDNLLYTYEQDLQSQDKQLGLLNILSAYQILVSGLEDEKKFEYIVGEIGTNERVVGNLISILNNIEYPQMILEKALYLLSQMLALETQEKSQIVANLLVEKQYIDIIVHYVKEYVQNLNSRQKSDIMWSLSNFFTMEEIFMEEIVIILNDRCFWNQTLQMLEFEQSMIVKKEILLLIDNALYLKNKNFNMLLIEEPDLKLLERIIQFLIPSQNSSCLKYCINITSHIFEHGKQLLKDNKYDDQIQNPFINRFMAKNGLNLLIEIEQKTSNTELYQQIYQFIEDYDLNNNNYF